MARKCCSTRLIYRYEPPAESGLRARWWGNAAGPHLDPLEWSGPADPVSGFPLPTAVAPNFDVVNNNTNVIDSNSGAGAARYGVIDGWVFLPDNVTHWRDNNGNTGELGMVLSGTCCGGSLTERDGGNHTTSTTTPDRTLMDSQPVSGGWHYIVSPQSDLSAFQGLQLQYSTDNEATWQNVTIKQPTKPVVECMEVKSCEPIPDGWQIKPLQECCQPMYSAGGGDTDEDAVTALIDERLCDDVPIPDNEVDTAIRTGSAGTSEEFARCDHNHPIRRQVHPAAPTIVAAGNATIFQQIVLDRRSTEEWIEYEFRIGVDVTAQRTWARLIIPAIGGFQQPIINVTGSYRFAGNPEPDDSANGNGIQGGAAPENPYMGNEWAHWSSTRQLYNGLNHFEATRHYVMFSAIYVRV